MEIKLLTYRLVIGLSKYLGYWPVEIFTWTVSSFYFLLFPSRVKNSVGFFKVLFPEKTAWAYYALAWKQFHSFAAVYVDRLKALNNEPVEIIEQDADEFLEAIEKKAGGVVIASHLGNWEAGASLLKKKRDFPFMLFVGEKQKEQIEKMQKMDLVEKGMTLLSISPDSASPFDLIEAVDFLKTGGFVSIAGDRLWTEKQQYFDANFSGRKVKLPRAPYLLSALCRVPLFATFFVRQGQSRFSIFVHKIEITSSGSRSNRKEAALLAAQEYANILEQMVRSYPVQWYHFESFLE